MTGYLQFGWSKVLWIPAIRLYACRDKEAVSQLLLALKKSLLFGFEALFALLFLPFLNCWTASKASKSGG